MKRRYSPKPVLLVFVLCLGIPGILRAADSAFAILPEEIQLTKKDATHRVIVEERSEIGWSGDRTGEAQFRSSHPDVAVVDEEGVVRAVGDGEATITATLHGEETATRVTVRGTQEPSIGSFRNHVQPILFKMGCSSGACHGAAAGKNGFKLSLRSYDVDWDHKVLTRQANGRRVSRADPEQSLMLLKPTQSIPHEGGERFEVGSLPYEIIRNWIESGAPPASDNDPRIERIEVFPKSVTLGLGARQRIVVRAHYDNGSYEDVTPWVMFGTTDESVAIVDREGNALVQGAGTASITATYASKVASASLLVPRDKSVAPELYARAERRNFIDDLVLARLERLQIAPAELASDTEFIRRAYLDSVGVLPQADEVTRFAMTADPDKRSGLIEELLGRPEFVDYWSYKWSDLFLLSSRNLTQRAELMAFYRFIRSSVAENKPWDRFAREIVTAKGSTLENGAANYFKMHQETIDLTETTSQVFLGMSITCARCHNHPLEKWTQDDYYGMANLMARVKLKAGRRGIGAEVLPAEFGDIIHPRIGEPVAPKPLDGEAIAIDAPGDRREHLADWLTSPENPYFTRAIVNRVWRNFMGRGLVEAEDDLRLTNPASNEALLTALADDLIAHGHDLKHLMRTIMNSAAYQRSSAPADPLAPDDKYYSHYIVRRLSAEVILDAYSQVTGVPTPFKGYPKGYRALQLADSQVGSYFLTVFGRPPRNQTCSCERTEASSVAQTLHVANGDTLNEKLRDDGSIAAELAMAGASDSEALEAIYLKALSRYPNASERERAIALLAEASSEGEGWLTRRREAFEDLTWAVLSGKEFMFNH